ncbi:MAG: MBL fold metallo-hydrolase [Deltaproteobacteria bacterium]|nr:MBL fold metallo-hydrolase [Deltaproteobacteria bacterium]
MKKRNRDKNGRFFNPWHGSDISAGRYLQLIKWLVFSKNQYRAAKKKPVEFRMERPDFKGLDAIGKDYLVWLGHSTVFIRAGGKAIITDPIFWDINFLIRRKTGLPIRPEDLPPVDYVLISHGHFDHLNTRSIRFLHKRDDPVFIAGPGFEGYFKSVGAARYIALDWWAAHTGDGVKITALPVQHWSKRGFFDTNRMLWCSFLIESAGARYYWIGDTGYYEGFKEIGERLGPVDVLMAPVGAYEPRWFMQRFHVNPEEAVRIARDVGARLVIPIHWGTFDLTDEPLWLPIKRLKEIVDPDAGPPVKILNHGGHFIVRG